MDDELKRCIAEDYLDGMSLNELSDAHSMSSQHASTILTEMGIRKRLPGKRGLSEKTKKMIREIVARFDRGETVCAIALAVGYSHPTVVHVLKMCERRPRRGAPRTSFREATDGSVKHRCSRCGRWLSLTSFSRSGAGIHHYCRRCNSDAAMAWSLAKKGRLG